MSMLKGAKTWTVMRGELPVKDREAITERVRATRTAREMPELGEIELLVDDDGRIVPPNEPAPTARAKQ